MALNIVFVFSILTLSFVTINCSVVVQTKSGKIAGFEVNSIVPNEKYYSFLGIPYAKPPVNELRFKAPQPHPGWDDILEANKERKHCAQFNQPDYRLQKNFGFCGDEDCLHLSIHTPKVPTDEELNFPVIVFLYNENFKVSYNATKDYSPDFFMKEDVIVITINYRINSLGFLSFQDNLLPGNNGLRDVILALTWIRDNIKAFGGDPSRVTLMGVHGGGVIANILLHSPKAKGLFSAAIMQSGTSWNPLFFDSKARKRAIALSEYLEDQALTSSYLLQALADKPAKKLTESEIYILDIDEGRAVQRNVLLFGPILEHEHPDAVITELPEKDPKPLDVPVMIGYNSREGIDISSHFLDKPNHLTYAERDFLLIFPRRVNYHFRLNDNVYNHAIEEIKDFYFEEGYVKISKPGEYITYIGDVLSFYPIDYTVRSYTNITNNSPIYYYTFDYSGELNYRKKSILDDAVIIEGTWGATFTDELCYLFICNPLRKTYKNLLEENAEEITVLNNMIRLWTNFAKTGKPTKPEDSVQWKPATKENKECLVINDKLELKSHLHKDRVDFWDKFIEKYEKLAVDGVVKDIKDEL